MTSSRKSPLAGGLSRLALVAGACAAAAAGGVFVWRAAERPAGAEEAHLAAGLAYSAPAAASIADEHVLPATWDDVAAVGAGLTAPERRPVAAVARATASTSADVEVDEFDDETGELAPAVSAAFEPSEPPLRAFRADSFDVEPAEPDDETASDLPEA